MAYVSSARGKSNDMHGKLEDKVIDDFNKSMKKIKTFLKEYEGYLTRRQKRRERKELREENPNLRRS